MTSPTAESPFQRDILRDLEEGGWTVGTAAGYDRARALYTEDCLAFVKATQSKMWAKYEGLYPKDPEGAFLDRLTAQLDKADPGATDKHLRLYGTLGVLRHGLKDKSCSFKLCQFQPDHGLNPETLAAFQQNILRVVPEIAYSPYASAGHLAETGAKSKAWRIDLVLFVNGLPVATLELKSEFKQAVRAAIDQYKKTRLPKDPATNRPEPLLTFKRGALVHFAVSQYEVWMTTRLAGEETRFLPFNRGTSEGGAGNDTPADIHRYATDYLWREVLAPESLLRILGRFVHLEIKEKEAFDGRKFKQEALIFPRYHQLDLVSKLLEATRREGPGQKYLVQHSAGSGKSNSIAWTAHQLASLYTDSGEKLFHSVIVVTDRTVLDSQLQDTIYQFEHAEGVIGKISRDEGQGSKSEKLAAALESSTPIIIVTIQTFPFVLQSIENSVSLKARSYAIIADEAHSSQTGRTATGMKKVLTKEAEEEAEDLALSSEEIIAANVAARKSAQNLSYYAFTATPKSKTLELFGRPADPSEPASKTNKPLPFHVYSMRQAIEEGYILDVLRNYTSYKVAWQLAQKATKADLEVDAKKAKTRLGQWVKLHDYNIAQKVQVIVEHFYGRVSTLLGGKAKAMIVTASRKEAVRYKLGFDKYVAERGYRDLASMVAFSGEVEFASQDPNAEGLLGSKFTESNMNPGLRGRDMRKAFDTDEYNVMIVAQKFQTGFDQPKLCAMYVDKPLGGVECVQTLSRLNRTFPGKDTTFVLDFVNDPDEVLKAFQEYFQTAELLDVSDPDRVFDLEEKLKHAGIFLMSEVTQYSEVFYSKNKSQAALSSVMKPATSRWELRYKDASAAAVKAREIFARTKKTGDPVLIGNAENELKEATKELDALGTFKADLRSFSRTYEFMSQIVDYDSKELEKLSLFAHDLYGLLRENTPAEEPIDLSSVELSHYRVSLQKQQDLMLLRDGAEGLQPASEVGTRKPRDKKEEFLSQIIARLNEIFITDGLTDSDLLNFASWNADELSENSAVMDQIKNNSREQAKLGQFNSALEAAILKSREKHGNLVKQVFSDQRTASAFGDIVFDFLLAKMRGTALGSGGLGGAGLGRDGPPSSRR